nr:cubilin-like [Cherax quadricarinatus]
MMFNGINAVLVVMGPVLTVIVPELVIMMLAFPIMVLTSAVVRLLNKFFICEILIIKLVVVAVTEGSETNEEVQLSASQFSNNEKDGIGPAVDVNEDNGGEPLHDLATSTSPESSDERNDATESASEVVGKSKNSNQFRPEDLHDNGAMANRDSDRKGRKIIPTDWEEGKDVDSLWYSDNLSPSHTINRFIDDFIRNSSSQNVTTTRTTGVRDSTISRRYLSPSDSNFTTRVTTGQCGGVIAVTNKYQTITTPNYPDNYPENSLCIWNIYSRTEKDYDQILIWIQDFELEGSDCSGDSLKITDVTVRKTAIFCGEKSRRPLFSMGNSLKLTFTSDNAGSRRGFTIGIKGIYSTCGVIHNTIGNEPLVLSTPNFPQAFPEETRCHWLIVSKGEMALRLMHDYSDNGSHDSLFISTDFLNKYDKYNLQRIYVSNVFSIIFVAKLLLEKSQQHLGLQFQLLPTTTTQSCDQTLTVTANSTVVINSSRYPSGYDPSTNCQWTIKYDTNNHYMSSLRFIDFDVENHINCRYDSLQIIDEMRGFSKTYCGKEKNFEYFTESKILKLHFKSDSRDIYFHKGFSLYASAERIRRDECVVTRPESDTWIIKSPVYKQVSPAFTVCSITIRSTTSLRFSVRFDKFSLQKSDPCNKGNYLSIEDVDINTTELFCGGMGGHKFTTAGNAIKLFYSSESKNSAEGFNIEIKSLFDSDCGGSYKLRPGESKELNAHSFIKLEKECVWVIQGINGILVLDFEQVENVRVSLTGLRRDLYNYNSRTIHFLEPSNKYMILAKENNVKFQATAYTTFSHCESTLSLRNTPVILNNLGNSYCSQVVSFSSNDRDVLFAIQYTLLSSTHSSPCPLEVVDAETGTKRKVCNKDWKKTFTVLSEKLYITPAIPEYDISSKFMLLLKPVKFTCGDTYEVKNKIILRSKNMEVRETCVYKLTSERHRIALDVATESKEALTYISVSTDGSFYNLKELSSATTTSLVTTKEFLVVVKPFPRSVSFVLQAIRESPVTSSCNTCVIVEPGSEGIIKSPSSPNLNTYPSGLFCSVKFESENKNRSVILEIEYLDLPTNTSLDSLFLVKDGIWSAIDASRLPILNQNLILETPFFLQFRTLTNNKHKGYRIRYKVNECGGVVTLNNNTAVTLQSPGYGDVYPTYIQCVWLFNTNITNISDRIKLKIVEFDLHESDSFEVFDPLYSKVPVAIFRGSAANQGIRSVGSQLKVVFTSDSRYVSSGFVFRVRAVVSGCGGDIDTSIKEEGTITTLDAFPNTDYCLFRLRPSQGRVMTLTPLKTSNNRQEREHLPRKSLRLPEEPELVRDNKCHVGSVVISTTGFLRDGQRFCVGDPVAAISSTQDVLVVVKAPPLPPVEFLYHTGSCGGELAGDKGLMGFLSSPNFPDMFTGPVTCTWTSSGPLLITLTYLDIQPSMDSLIFADHKRVITLTSSQIPRYLQLDGPATIIFSGNSIGVKTGFHLQYESVEVNGVWDVGVSAPVILLGWQGAQTRPSVWKVRAPIGSKGLTLRLWAAYIPNNPQCKESFLLVYGEADMAQRLCGGLAMNTLHFVGRDMVLSLQSSSPLAAFIASDPDERRQIYKHSCIWTEMLVELAALYSPVVSMTVEPKSLKKSITHLSQGDGYPILLYQNSTDNQHTSQHHLPATNTDISTSPPCYQHRHISITALLPTQTYQHHRPATNTDISASPPCYQHTNQHHRSATNTQISITALLPTHKSASPPCYQHRLMLLSFIALKYKQRVATTQAATSQHYHYHSKLWTDSTAGELEMIGRAEKSNEKVSNEKR